MPTKTRPLIADLRAELTNAADPSKAESMRAYMKSAMPYHGVSMPALRAICKRMFAERELASAEAWRAEVLALWRGARYREERYAAIELSGVKQARPYQTLDALPMYEELIVTGAWWDYVDTLAVHRVGGLLVRHHPGKMKRLMRAWSQGDDLWKRRTSILCQVSFKADTDLDLLYTCIEPSLPSKEFFLRKAIGWALRQHAWTDPGEITRYVEAHAVELSRLSKREALKNIEKRDRSPA